MIHGYVFQKILNNGITKDNTQSTETVKVYKIRVEASDTETLEYGDYYYDLQLVANTDDVFTPIRGALKINWDITR